VKVAVMAGSCFPDERIQTERKTPTGTLPAGSKLFQVFQKSAAQEFSNKMKINYLRHKRYLPTICGYR
jgi:hypothetical protein